MAEFIIQSGKHVGKRLTIPPGKVVIGRDEDCQIRTASSDISRRHCALQIDADGVTAEDLGSRNGTFVNDVPITATTRLKPGDVLRVGPMIFQVPTPSFAPASPPVVATPATRSPAADAAPSASGAGKRGKKRASEDDIAGWLTDDDDETSELSSASDTTIIPGVPRKKKSSADVAATAAPAPSVIPAAPKPEKKAFHTIGEEAADIIRRHWESVRAKKS